MVRRQAEYVIDSMVEEVRRKNKLAFEEYIKKHFAGVDATIVYAEGNMEKRLLKIVDQYCADLIIIGSMSTKGLLGGLFNHSSENIIGRTRVPVLVVPNELSLECVPEF